jgi:allantoin racemase
MQIMVINPNTTATMTRSIERACRRVAAERYDLTVCNPERGVASIEGNADGAIAAFHLLELIERSARTQQVDGYVIACFDDTGLHAAREIVAAPVVGIGEAALHVASLVSARFSVLTTLQRSVAILERNARAYGFSGETFRVHASHLAVLDLESEQSYAKLLARAQEVLAQDHAECLVLGCGGMSMWSTKLAADLAVPVIDGVTAALSLVECLVGLGIGTSKAVTYAYPTSKQLMT